MSDNTPINTHYSTLMASIIILTAITLIAVFTRLWVLTAIPIGFLFGFLLQKGDLCGASAFSEVVLMKDWKKIWGLWVLIVSGMVSFAVLDLLGLVTLNPKPFLWLNYIIGGALFGIGMVLAGGCVSGCLFKTGTGNLNSMAALPGIALGVAMVEHGPLHAFHTRLNSYAINSADGGPVTFGSITGLPFWALALLIASVTILGAVVYTKRSPASEKDREPRTYKLGAKSWQPWQAGLLIGLLGAFAYLSSALTGRNYPLGVTHGVLHAQLLITETNLDYIYQKKPAKARTAPLTKSESRAASAQPLTHESTIPKKKVSWWLIALVCSIVVGSRISGKLSGVATLKAKPPEQVLIAFLGGFLVGAGAAFARGCVVGNIMSGWALMSVGTVFFGIIVLLTNWLTTYFYLMGGGLSDLPVLFKRGYKK